jgi:hypothetical protein
MQAINWRSPLNQFDYEQALDAGQLFIAMRSGAWWQCRRNGQTKTWKRSPNRFYIPIKYGFRGYHAITETDAHSCFRIANRRADAEAA